MDGGGGGGNAAVVVVGDGVENGGHTQRRSSASASASTETVEIARRVYAATGTGRAVEGTGRVTRARFRRASSAESGTREAG